MRFGEDGEYPSKPKFAQRSEPSISARFALFHATHLMVAKLHHTFIQIAHTGPLAVVFFFIIQIGNVSAFLDPLLKLSSLARLSSSKKRKRMYFWFNDASITRIVSDWDVKAGVKVERFGIVPLSRALDKWVSSQSPQYLLNMFH